MQKNTLKIVAILTTLLLVGTILLPTLVYASDEIQDGKTSQENVSFNATIQNKYEAKLNLLEEATLELNLAVKNTGYLKDISVTLEGKNYELITTKKPEQSTDILKVDEQTTLEQQISSGAISSVTGGALDAVQGQASRTLADQLKNSTMGGSVLSEANNQVSNTVSNNSETNNIVENNTVEETQNDTESINKIKSIQENIIELNEIKAGENTNIKLPIKFKENKEISVEDYNKESTVTLNAIYVNEKGKEKKITKTITHKIEWTLEVSEKIEQNLTRYLKYNNNTMIGMEISDEVEPSNLPITKREISVTPPKINNQNPSKIIPLTENSTYKYENSILTITQETEGKLPEKATHQVIYIYDTQADQEQIETSATAIVTTIKNDTITGATTNNSFNVTEQVGSLVELGITNTGTLSKGYMFTNTNKTENKLATNYEEKYNINFGLAELVDKIIIEQKESSFVTEQGYYDVTNNITTNKIKVDNIEKILGADGKIIIKDIEGNEIVALTNEKQEAEISVKKFIIETTKPATEGNLELTLSKEIGDLGLGIEELKTVNKLTTNINIKGYKNETEISNTDKIDEITLQDPKSKATLEVSQSTLSTVAENKDVIFNVVLNKSNIQNALYKNPKIKITLPKQVNEIKVKDARVLYENEITAGSINLQSNEIEVQLQGTQTEYSSSATEEGALVRIVADVKLDNLATSDEGDIKLNYINEATGENNTIEGKMKVEAPTGFVTTNTIKVEDKEATAVENDSEIEIPKKSETRKMNIKGVIINNLGNNAEGLTIIGRIPFKGNKTIEGKDLGTTVDTTLSTPITVTGLENVAIYYSTDENANLNSQNWTTEALQGTKSYKIVVENGLSDKTKAEFSYDVTIPADLPSKSSIKENYGVYYNNNSVEGIKTNLVESKTVGASTTGVADIELTTEVYDTNTGNKIENGQVTEGEYITYWVKIMNKGTKNLENAKLKLVPGKGLKSIVLVGGTDIDPIKTYEIDEEENFVRELPTIEPNKGCLFRYDLLAGKAINTEKPENNQYTSKVQVMVNNDKENIEEIESKLNIVEGTVNLKLTSDLQSIMQPNVVLKDREFNYIIDLYNVNKKEKNNVEVKLELPKGIEFLSSETEEQYNYDKNSNTVTFKVGKMEGSASTRLQAKVKITTDERVSLEAVAKAKCAESNVEVQSNPLEISTNSLSEELEVTQRLSIESGKMMDTDTVEIYLDVKNNSDSLVNINYNNSIPKELKVLKAQTIIENEVVDERKTNYLMLSMELDVGETGRFLIQAQGRTLAKDKTETIEIKPTLNVAEAGEVAVNPVTLQIQGTGNFQTNGNPDGTYNIQGVAWLDANNNGKKEASEQRISGVQLQLYNTSTGELVKDASGNPITVTTSESGNYTFANQKAGRYNIVAKYDVAKYDLGVYKEATAQEGENSDFVLATLDGKEVASTDVLTLQGSNLYNIDLGLVDKNTFDLKLDKTITKIVVTNSKNNRTNSYDFNSNVAKVELGGSNVEYNTVLVEYKISVSNIGHVAGYAKSIVDYLPKDMTFNSELNNTWYTDRSGNAYNTSLANTIINPGETKDITLVLSKKITGENLGTIRNTAEIAESYNEYSIKDINSIAGNKQDGENDMSSADAIIGMSTGREIMKVTGISIGLLALVALAVFTIKKILMPKFTIDLK